jgi:hypothetical protein
MTLLTLFFLFGLCVLVIASLALVIVDLDVVLKLLLTGFVVPVLNSGVIKNEKCLLFFGTR